MKNPLRKRLLRELRQDIGKYIAIFLLLFCTIGLVSGFLVANISMIATYDESFEKYNIEDGHFSVQKQLNAAQRKRVQALGISVYDLFYADEEAENGTTLRIFTIRDEIDRQDVMSGRLPTGAGELAIDRKYAEENGFSVGDTVLFGGRSYTITGLVALSDYSSLFESSSDTMFDAQQFGVAVVTADVFASIPDGEKTFCYAWLYDEAPADDLQRHNMGEDLLDALNDEIHLTGYVPRDENQAITFTGEDMVGDKSMFIVFLYIIIVIIAFVFTIISNSTITQEASVIGTLRASGYTKGELIRHYMAMPVIVTLFSALLGNIAGYTVFESVCRDMYYNSYSLPTYHTVPSAEAFLETTVVPCVLMVIISYMTLRRKLSLSPLKFLRRDLSRGKGRRAPHLPERLPFFSRFRTRILIQNFGSYVLLAVGILFANLMLLYGLVFNDILKDYQNSIADTMLADYQYILTVPVDMTDGDNQLSSLMAGMEFSDAVSTENENAEKFSVTTLKTVGDIVEDVTIYGLQEDSAYVPLEVGNGEVYISSAYAEKYLLSPGDTILLKEEYTDDAYRFTVTGVYDYDGAIAVFTDLDTVNRVAGYEDGFFCGYFSNEELTDLDPDYVGTVIDLTAMTKVSRQLSSSIGFFAYLMDVFAIVLFLVIIYILGKIIIEKNAQSISMARILGYSPGEIARLYINSLTVAMVVIELASLPVETVTMAWLFRVIMTGMMSGWIPFAVRTKVYFIMVALALGAYAVVAVFEYRKIKQVPMSIALKNVE